MSRGSPLDPTLMGVPENPYINLLGNLAMQANRERAANQASTANTLGQGLDAMTARRLQTAQLIAQMKQERQLQQQRVAAAQTESMMKALLQQGQQKREAAQLEAEMALRERMGTARNASELQQTMIQASARGERGAGSTLEDQAAQEFQALIAAKRAAGMSYPEAVRAAEKDFGSGLHLLKPYGLKEQPTVPPTIEATRLQAFKTALGGTVDEGDIQKLTDKAGDYYKNKYQTAFKSNDTTEVAAALKIGGDLGLPVQEWFYDDKGTPAYWPPWIPRPPTKLEDYRTTTGLFDWLKQRSAVAQPSVAAPPTSQPSIPRYPGAGWE